MHTLSPDQAAALNSILKWYKEANGTKQYITLGGFAGTGKTTLIATLRKELLSIKADLKIGFASYTGKASRVLKNKLLEQKTLQPKDSVSTIHALIYSPIVNDREEIVGWQRKDRIDRDLIIIDEASMVDANIWQHLISYNIPIIAVGDHGQLPPIEGNFNLMAAPEIRLTHIHRQAETNPIIGLSIQAREHGLVKLGDYGSAVKKYDMSTHEAGEMMSELLGNIKSDTLVLCGYNMTRNRLNQQIRSSLGFETKEPTVGDRVICLRNNHKKNIYNGMLGTIVSIKPDIEGWYLAEIAMDDEENAFKGLILAKQFGAPSALNFSEKRAETMIGDLFDFGYAMTVHKAQGSQAKRVVLLEERFAKMTDDQWRRWLYTGITRAEEELFMFGRGADIPNA